MRGGRSAVLRFHFVLFQVMRHFGGYLVFRVRKGLRLSSSGHEMKPEVRLRLFLQDVDGAIIKLGQILAMRVDFLPPEYVQELLKLLDEVPPFDSVVAKGIIEEELGAPITALFESFDDVPIAAASFGQAHAAVLHGGDSVIVKVQRPGIADVITADLKIFRTVAFLIDATGLSQRSLVEPIIDDFSEWTKEELDYRIEGSHVQEIHDKAVESKTERIPIVYWTHTSIRVLTLERLHGIWVKEIMQGLENNPDATLEKLSSINTSLLDISQNLLRNTLRQVFIYGVHHADPHGANLLVMDDGVIGYVDFGITGRLTQKARDLQVKTHVALESGDFDQFYEVILESLSPPYYADLSRFERRVKSLYTDWLNCQSMGRVNIREKSFARLMLGINDAAQWCGATFANAEVRVFRTLATVDAVILKFAPTLDVRAEFRSFFSSYKTNKLISTDIPALLHKLPELVKTMSDVIDPPAVICTTRVSMPRRILGVAFQVLAIALVVWGIASLLVPSLAKPTMKSLQLAPSGAIILLIVAIVFCVWLSHLFKLRSVVRDVVVGPRRNPFHTDRER